MAATMSIKEVNGGATPVATTVTNCRFCTTDDYNPGSNYTMVKPAAGNNYSYKKTVYLNADTSPTSSITNGKFYCDGSIDWTGMSIEVQAADTYSAPTGTEGTTGDDEAINDDIENYPSGTPLSLTGSLSNPSTGKVFQYVEMQAVLTTSATAGQLSTETLTFQYDEV